MAITGAAARFALRHSVTVGQGRKGRTARAAYRPAGIAVAFEYGDGARNLPMKADVTWVIAQEEGDAAIHLASSM